MASGVYFIYKSAATDTLALRSGVDLLGGFTGVETDEDGEEVEVILFTEHVVTVAANGARAVFAADLDGDGTDELYVASPFPPENRLVMAIGDVDTTYRRRGAHYDRIASWIARHPRLEGPIRKWSPYLLPVILIAIGWYVLSDTGTDTL